MNEIEKLQEKLKHLELEALEIENFISKHQENIIANKEYYDTPEFDSAVKKKWVNLWDIRDQIFIIKREIKLIEGAQDGRKRD